MAKKITQYRWQNGVWEGGPSGFLVKLEGAGTEPKNAIISLPFMIQIGIQGMPGLKFYFNGNDIPIVMGNTGIYELDTSNFTYISEIKFDGEVLSQMEPLHNEFIIVDIIYEEEDDS